MAFDWWLDAQTCAFGFLASVDPEMCSVERGDDEPSLHYAFFLGISLGVLHLSFWFGRVKS